jgi:HD superfamily phosphohydrolase
MANPLKEMVQKTRSFLLSRALAYQQVFNPESLATEAVLKDLAKFCRANESTFHADPRIHAVLEGRREVWLRIQHQLKLDADALWKLYGRKDIE